MINKKTSLYTLQVCIVGLARAVCKTKLLPKIFIWSITDQSVSLSHSHTNMYARTCPYTYMCVVCVCMYAHVYAGVCACACVCMDVCMCGCVCMCMSRKQMRTFFFQVPFFQQTTSVHSCLNKISICY